MGRACSTWWGVGGNNVHNTVFKNHMEKTQLGKIGDSIKSIHLLCQQDTKER
jgi:hypothetical protein